MRISKEILEPLLEYDEDRLGDWLFACLMNGDCESLGEIPEHYDGPTDFLLDCLNEINDEGISRCFGNAACRAYRRFVDEAYSSISEQSLRIRVASGLLCLIESLPCAPRNAEQVVASLLFFLADYSRKELTEEEVDIRAKMLLALVSKLYLIRTLKPKLAEIFEDELKHPVYAEPAYAIMLNLNRAFAAEHFKTVLETLQNSDRRTIYLVRRAARAVSARRRDSDILFEAVVNCGDERVKEQFLDQLKVMNPSR